MESHGDLFAVFYRSHEALQKVETPVFLHLARGMHLRAYWEEFRLPSQSVFSSSPSVDAPPALHHQKRDAPKKKHEKEKMKRTVFSSYESQSYQIPYFEVKIQMNTMM